MKVSDACDMYNSTNGDCLTCQNMKYRVESGRCLDPNCELYFGLECKMCKSGFEYRESEGLCRNDDKNCERTGETEEICEECKNGFYLSSEDRCMEFPKNCLKVNQEGEC